MVGKNKERIFWIDIHALPLQNHKEEKKFGDRQA